MNGNEEAEIELPEPRCQFIHNHGGKLWMRISGTCPKCGRIFRVAYACDGKILSWRTSGVRCGGLSGCGEVSSFEETGMEFVKLKE